MNEPHYELGTSYLSDAELDAAEAIASYSTDEVELHRLARQTLPQLIREVRLHRIDDHPADRTDGSSPQNEGGRLREILDAARERSGLSEEEAMRLAIAEQKAYRSS